MLLLTNKIIIFQQKFTVFHVGVCRFSMALQDSLCWFSGLNEFSRLSALSNSTKMFAMKICIRNSIEPSVFSTETL
jgi:hypothetical protein